ncbi:hypothetical protein [Halorarum salinum]|nr:hypothetical protein [Halobaculum salinum]
MSTTTTRFSFFRSKSVRGIPEFGPTARYRSVSFESGSVEVARP